MFSHITALILRPGTIVTDILLSFNDTGSEMISGPKFKFNSSYSVARCHSTDEWRGSSNTSYNIDGKFVIREEGNRLFYPVKTRLICIASFFPLM